MFLVAKYGRIHVYTAAGYYNYFKSIRTCFVRAGSLLRRYKNKRKVHLTEKNVHVKIPAIFFSTKLTSETK